MLYWSHPFPEIFMRPAARLLLLSFALAAPHLAAAQTTAAPLPEAPSPSHPTQPYFQPTAADNFRAYRRELIGPRPFIHAGIRAGIEQIRTVPDGWGQDFPGFAQRYGSAYGEAAIDTTVRFSMGTALHEDVRYLVCHGCSFGQKLRNAALYEVSARHGADGHRVFSVTPIVSSFSGPMIAYAAWYPPGPNYNTQGALKHSLFGLGTRIIFHMVREYTGDRESAAQRDARKYAAATP
jgi:hypothetical protein